MAQNPIKSALDASKTASRSAIDASKDVLDASKDAAQQAQDQIEALLRDLAASAEAQSNAIQSALTEFRERSKENSDRLAEVIDKQVKSQLGSLGLATQADIARLECKIAKLEKPAKKAAAKKSTAKKPTAKKAAAKKADAS